MTARVILNHFIIGMGSLLDITGNYYTSRRDKTRTDAEAIYSDTQALGRDMEKSLIRFNNDHRTK